MVNHMVDRARTIKQKRAGEEHRRSNRVRESERVLSAFHRRLGATQRDAILNVQTQPVRGRGCTAGASSP